MSMEEYKSNLEKKDGIENKKEEFDKYQKIVVEELQKHPVEVIPEVSVITIRELKERFPDKKIFTCDFAIKDIELGEEIIGGYRAEDVVGIDHHAPVPRMSKQISSTNLALEYVKKYGIAPENVIAVINHTDCDSVLSIAIIRGILSPDIKFGNAAIAADHTGEKNEIADLLQALQDKRSLEYSLTNLKLFLDHKDLDENAKILLEKRIKDRERAEELVAEGKFKQIGNVWYTQLDKKIDGGLLPALLPDAMVIILVSPMKDSDKLEIKVRLGKSAPDGFMLNKLNLPDFGGRWNAGSTKRSGGTSLAPEQYAKIVDEKVKQYLAGIDQKEQKLIFI